MPQTSLVGTWKLVSFEVRKADDQVEYTYGKDAVGYIIYTEDGYMSVAIMSANRSTFAAGDPRGGTQEEKAAAMETYITYGGPYEIQGNRVIHHIEICSSPNWVGVDHERFFNIENDQLILKSPPILWEGAQQVGVAIWERYSTR